MEEIFKNFGNPFSFYQLIGWIGLFFFVVSFQFKKTRHTILFYIPADICYAIQFYGLNSYSSMIIAISAIFRSIAGVWFSKRIMTFVVILHAFIAWCALLLFMNTPIEAFGAIGATFMSVSIWFRDKYYLCRGFAAGHQISWLILYTAIGSYSGVTMMTMTLLSNIIGIMRHSDKTGFMRGGFLKRK